MLAPAAAQVALWAREVSQSDGEYDGSAAEEDEDGEGGEEEGEEEAVDVAAAAGSKRKAGVNELPQAARIRKPTARAAAAAAAKRS